MEKEKNEEEKLYYPPLGFCFRVSFLEKKDLTFNFQSVSGLTKEVVTESIREGGQSFDYALPTKVQYAELSLKRGLLIPGASDFNQAEWHAWFLNTLDAFRVTPKNLKIELLGPKRNVLMAWNVQRAWPKKWVIADFNAEENQVVIETMDLHYDSFTITDIKEKTPEKTPE